VQILLGQDIKSRFCPVIRFHKDEKFKKTIETLNIIDRAIQEIDDNKQKPLQEIKGQ
jgi:ribosome-binding factor A